MQEEHSKINIPTSNTMKYLLKRFEFSDRVRNYFKNQLESKKTSLHRFFAKLLEKADLDLVVNEYRQDIGLIEDMRCEDKEFARCIEYVEEKGKRLKSKLALDHLYKMAFKDPKLLLTFLKHTKVIEGEAQDLQAAREQEVEEEREDDKNKLQVTLETFNSDNNA